LHLLQLCLVYINTILIQNVLSEPQWAKLIIRCAARRILVALK